MPTVTVESKDLSGALSWVMRVIPARPPVPALGAVVLTEHGGSITLGGQDGQEAASMTVPCSGDGEFGKRLLPARLLADLAKGVERGPVTLEVDEGKVVVTAGRSTFRLPLFPDEDYPSLPRMGGGGDVVPGAVFAEAIGSVVIAAGRDDTLPTLTAVYTEADPAAGTLTLVCTDRFRLARRAVPYVPADPAEEPWSMLLPAKGLTSYVKALSGEPEIRLVRGGRSGNLGLVGADRWVSSRVLDGEYLRWRPLLGSLDPSATAVVEAEELLGAVKRAALLADASTPVLLSFDPVGEVTVSADTGVNASSETLACTFSEDEPFRVGFNHSALAEALTVFGAQEVSFGMSGPGKPVLLSVPGQSETYVHLLIAQRV